MEDIHHFDISVDVDGSPPSILMDDIPLRGIRSFRVDCPHTNVSTVTLVITATSNISGDSQVWVSDDTKALENRVRVAETRADIAEAETEECENRENQSPLTDP